MKYANRLSRSVSAALSVFMVLFSIQTSGIRFWIKKKYIES